jgi:hypothetical protein
MTILGYLLGCLCVLIFIKRYNKKMKKGGIESEIIPLENSILIAIFSWVSLTGMIFVFIISTKTFMDIKNWFES